MQLTSFWTQGKVFWRVFNWDDTVHIVGNAEGTFTGVGHAMTWTDAKFQMELKRADVFGGGILSASPTHLFYATDDLVLENDGTIRPFVYRTLKVTHPSAGAQLGQSRLNEKDSVSLVLNMGDLGRLVSLNDYLSDVTAYVIVKQPGFRDQEYPASIDSTVNGPIIVQFNASMKILHSGPATLIGELRSPSTVKRLFSDPIAVTVTPTGTRSFSVTLNNLATPNCEIDVPESDAALDIAVFADADQRFSSITVQTSLDGTLPPRRARDTGERPYGRQKWVVEPVVSIPWYHAPEQHRLRVIDRGFFDNEAEGVGPWLDFKTKDTAPPHITITDPAENAVFVPAQGVVVSESSPYVVTVRGNVVDYQSGYRNGSLGYFLNGGAKQSVAVAANGDWVLSIAITSYGPYTLSFEATDNSNNKTHPGQGVLHFQVRSSFKPETIDELLSPRAYLDELLSFVRSHVTTAGDGGSFVSPELLRDTFAQPFGDLAQPSFPGGDVPENELLMPVRMLRKGLQPIESAALVARYSFAEAQADGAKLTDRLGRFGLEGRYVGNLTGPADPTIEGAIRIDQDHYAVVDRNVGAMALGQGDFSVSFWMYISERQFGSWLAILFKGEPELDGGIHNRTFALWLHPESNRVHYRISTEMDLGKHRKDYYYNPLNIGGDSKDEIPLRRWTHVAYVLKGRTLLLYLNGRLDSQVILTVAEKVISNSQPLYIGRASIQVGFTGAMDELRLYAVALDADDVAQLAVDRNSELPEDYVADYHRRAYEALLNGLGTSFEEIRSLRQMMPAQRKALAERIGLWEAEDIDRLDCLSPKLAPAVYDATADFQASSNPGVIWGYGYSALGVDSYPVVWFDLPSKYPANTGAAPNVWNKSNYITSGTPTIWKNISDAYMHGVGAGQLCLHPGPVPDADFAVLRFTAPETRAYTVVGQFFSGDSGEMSGAILFNGRATPLVSFRITTDDSKFSLPALWMTKGQTLDFVVGNNGDYTCGSTPITVTITASEKPGTVGFELWLADVFGLPVTIPHGNRLGARTTPLLPNLRQIALVKEWQREDTGRTMPDLDPDLVDIDDLAPTAATWLQVLRARDAELKRKFDAFVQGTPVAALGAVYSTGEQTQLADLEARDARGEDIGSEFAALALDRTMFRRLMAYAKLIASATPLSSNEREDLAHLLTQVWKLRQCYPVWLEAERRIGPQRLWPNHLPSDDSSPIDAAWVPGNAKAGFRPWRGGMQLRAELEARLGSRLRAWQQLNDSQSLAIAEAQRIALPVLRDGLLGLGDLPAPAKLTNGLAQRWLVDFSAGGAMRLSAIDQAIGSLQTVVNGLLGGWFDEGHPAFTWSKAATATDFEKQWAWLDSYGSWRTAVTNYLYPENVLYPELRSANSSSPALVVFLKALGKLQPISKALLESPPDEYSVAFDAVTVSTTSADYYFAMVSIALALQRAGLYAAALEKYRAVYDTAQSTPQGRRLVLPMEEHYDAPPKAKFGDSNWTAHLDDPHVIATAGNSGCCNPYTRFTLFQILRCLLAQADDAFASGLLDGRARALALYLEAQDILDFEELQDLQPDEADQAYLPSPVLASLRAHTASALAKLRRGLSYLGTPQLPDTTRSAGGANMSGLIRPTPYRYRVLMERAKQLVQQAQQLEAQYLAAMEKGDAEAEKYLSSGFAVEIAAQTQDLRRLQVTEASHGLDLAVAQQTRSQIQKDRYQQWIAAGETANERAQVDNLWAAKTAKDLIAGFDATITGLGAAQGAAADTMSSFGAVWGFATGVSVAAAGRAITQGFLNDNETRSQVSGILASQERRNQEWQLQADLATQDVAIAGSQMVLAHDRIDIATSEQSIADSQHDHAKQMLAFLGKKFSSVQFYQWFMGELGQIYATFLRLATANAQNAELQLAFERQEQPARLIKSDYWQLAAVSAAAAGGSADSAGKSTAIDPKGVTGSARLLQDIYTLDEHAFSSDRRVLNLTQTFSLSRQMPIEFEDFRRTGILAFSTPMQWFDEGFPGHYMRLIKKVRVSVSALIPPSQGIRAMLTNPGLSRVVTADPGYPTMVIRQDPQMVALTSPMGSTGVFELDAQSDMLYPFEGTGVDTSWYFELPPAGNPFDFDSLVDVVLSIDYTAQFSSEVKDRVVKKLPRTLSGDRTFSIRRDFPDLWYELSNSSGTEVVVSVPLSKRNFPPRLKQLKIAEIAVSIRDTDGGLCEFLAALAMGDHSSSQTQAVRGIASSRQSGGAGWASVIASAGEISDKVANWNLKISDVPNANSPMTQSILAQLRSGKIDDIVVMATFSGIRPSW